ncbi:MAG: hypothetical protein IJ763_08920 [Lachnospiraceae bacterium]|nr:hypothetical protein [Lachnospiraceae bacterium]
MQDKLVVKTADNEYLYTYNEGENVLLTAEKLYDYDIYSETTLDDTESKLLSSKWYTIQSGISQSIMEYIFYENGDAICIDYEYEDGKWTEKYRYNYTYTYDSSDKSVSIDFGMDGLKYYYDGSYDAFIMDLTYFNYEYDANYYDRCLVPYDSFPDFDDLSNNCHYILDGKLEDINIDDDSNSNGNQNDAPSSVLTQDQAYNAVVNYCCVQNPELLNDTSGVQDYTYYWTIGELKGEYYTVDYRSYTAAHVYYHVNIYTGDVYTTEFVPGITDGEVAGNESFNAWSYVD